MNYLSLYRKYRPKTFKDVVGQEYIVQILKNSIKNNAVANAYVFAGTKGTGKTSIAKIYANAINCLNNVDGDICGNCEICKDFANNQVIDVLELDAASNSGKDEVKKIADAIYTLPTKLGKKVYIIDEAHMLTVQAWNALLKIIEEPPKHVVFIFATTEIHKVPATILSRCQCLRFNKILASDITKLLIKVADKENFKYDIEALKAIAELADGSARDALSILEQTATFSNNEIKVDEIYKIYGLLNTKEVVDFINLFTNSDSNELFKKANKYYQSGINFVSLANIIVSVLTDKLIYLRTKNYQLLSKTSETTINNLVINDANVLIKLLDIWQEAYIKLISPTDVQIIFNHALIKSIACFGQKTANVEKVEQIDVQPKVEEKPKVSEPTLIVKPFVLPTKKKANVEVKVDQPKEEKGVEVKEQPEIKPLPSIKDVLFATVANKDKEAVASAQKFFTNLKDNVITDKQFSPITLAKQVFCASNNAIVFAFRDELDAKILNKVAFSQDFILSTCKQFRDPKFIIGYSINDLNSMKDELLKAMKEKKFSLDIECLRQILDKDQTIEQLAFNTIYSKLDPKDRK